MKKLLIILFTLSSLYSWGQSGFYINGTTVNNVGKTPWGLGADSMISLPKSHDSASKFNSAVEGYLRYFTSTHTINYRDSLAWQQLISLSEFLDSLNNYVRIQTQNPTASISTPTLIFPYTSASTRSVNLNWTAGRLGATSTSNATAPLSTITVGGVGQSFSQPSAPGTVSGTQAVTIPTNTNTTESIVVVTTDGKSASQSINIQSQYQLYVGYVSSSTPSDADIIAATGGNVGGAFATTQNMTNPVTLAAPSGTLYTVICYPAIWGTSTIKIGGFATSYILTTRNFTNQTGNRVSSNIYVSPFPSAAAINYQIIAN